MPKGDLKKHEERELQEEKGVGAHQKARTEWEKGEREEGRWGVGKGHQCPLAYRTQRQRMFMVPDNT